jgi:fumarate reductase flavoprotein subunit
MIKANRRRFLTSTAALACSAALPRATLGAAHNKVWDLIVIGGGTAGLPTALFASRRAKVLVLERAPLIGGTLDRSTGQVAAAGTVFQARKNIADTPDDHYADIMRINGGTSDPELTRLVVNHAGSMLNWLAEQGYDVEDDHPVTGSGHEHFLIPRYQWGPKGGWSIVEALQTPLECAQNSGRLTINLNTSAVDLIIDRQGAVAGVVAIDATGRRVDYRARNVVLASGGCAANPSMFEELHGIPLYLQIANPNSQGIGITLGQAAGGYVRGGEKYATLFGAILAEDRYPSPPTAIPPLNPSLRKPWELLINANGERFVQEDHPSIDFMEKQLGKQPGHRHWIVFDEDILATAPPLLDGWTADDIRKAANEHPMFSKANTISELGVKTGVNPQKLAATIEAYNKARANNAPDPWGLQHRPLPITKAPFYAIRAQGWTLVSFAGLAVNPKLQVIRPGGEPVPNLYAAGEVIGAGATSGAAYTNGMLVTPAITFGRLLGERILPL